MKKTVVITGPVSSSGADHTPLYEVLVETVGPFAAIVHSPLDTMAFRGSHADLYRRGMGLISESSLVIALVGAPSTGQGMEIQEASRNGIPLVAIAPVNSKVSAMVLGCPALREVIYYESHDQLRAALTERLPELLGAE